MRGWSDDEADFRPDSTRFTLREVVAHLADWDAIFLERLSRTRDEHEPLLPNIDEGRLALDNEYSKSDLTEQLRLFGECRARLAAFARELTSEKWQRNCQHQRVGRLTLEGLALLIPLHDAYHLRQVMQWRQTYHRKVAMNSF